RGGDVRQNGPHARRDCRRKAAASLAVLAQERRRRNRNLRTAHRCKKKESQNEREQTALKRVRMPDFVAPELARLVDAPPVGPNWVHEAKFDGYRMQLRVEAGRAQLRTRKGLDWSDRFPEIVAEGAKLSDCMLDGEVCAITDGLPNFAGLQQALSDGKTGSLV